MLKRLLRYCFFSACSLLLTSYLLGCAPRVVPPPLYKDIDLTLEEIITIAKRDISSLKAIVNMSVEKDDMPYPNVDASLFIKKPNWLHIRVYRFGILIGDFLMKDNVVHTASGKGANKFREFGRELYYSIFWWEGIEDAMLYKHAEAYVIRTENKEIRINKSTLLPESQEIIAGSKKIHILYDEPKNETHFWYPSVIKIEMGVYMVTVKVTKLFINPTPPLIRD